MSLLPDPYYKARRNVTIASALLLSWEFLGIGPESPKAAEATLKLPLIGTELAIKHHQAIPLTLFIITLFLVIRYIVEWFHVSGNLRSKLSPKLDLYITITLSIIAVGVYTFQSLSGFDVATYVTINEIIIAIAIIIIVCMIVVLIEYFIPFINLNKNFVFANFVVITSGTIMITFLALINMNWYEFFKEWNVILINILLISVPLAIVMAIGSFIGRRSREAPSQLNLTIDQAECRPTDESEA